MASNYRKFVVGDPIGMSARLFNDLVDVSKKESFSPVSDAGPFVRELDIVKVKNNSGGNLDRWNVVGLTGLLLSPTTNLNEFLMTPGFLGSASQTPRDQCNFAVTIEPIAAGAIGRAAVGGVVPVQVTLDPNNIMEWAEVGSGVNLKNVPSGSARILALQNNGASTQWALVRLGNGTQLQLGKIKVSSSAGTGWDTTSASSNTIASSGSFSFTVASGLNWLAGDTVLVDAGSGNTITGTVTSYSGTTLVFTATASTGAGTFNSWNVHATVVQSRYPGTYYDFDLNQLGICWVVDDQSNLPSTNVFYPATRASNANGRRVYRTNVSDAVVLSVACVSGSPVATVGAAL